jgi:arylformamidase
MNNSTSAIDTEWLDRMYNNRALVPDHAVYFARWAETSRSAREHLARLLDLPYGNRPGETLDVFPAKGFDATQVQAGAPVLVFIHGGYWRSLDKADHSFIAPRFTEAGACVVIPNYALCPAVTIPDIVAQMARALAWTRQHVGEYGGDPRRITVAGHSAGGHLAAMLLIGDPIKNALSISGLYDLEPLRHTPCLKDLNLTPEQVGQASPALLPKPEQGALYTVAGGDESEEFLRQNQLIRRAWGARAVPVCESFPGCNHFSVLETLIEPSHRLHRLALELLGLDTAPRG